MNLGGGGVFEALDGTGHGHNCGPSRAGAGVHARKDGDGYGFPSVMPYTGDGITRHDERVQRTFATAIEAMCSLTRRYF